MLSIRLRQDWPPWIPRWECDLPDMQPLSRVRPNTIVHFSQRDTMQRRQALAAKIADCISQFSTLESMLGISLSLMLHADAYVILSMYSAMENRSAQLRMLQAGAEAKLSKEQATLMSALLALYVKPLMKNRDKFVHWVWGFSDDLPDALLITNITDAMYTSMTLVGDIEGEPDVSKVFVVTDSYLTRVSDDTQTAIESYARFTGHFGIGTTKPDATSCSARYLTRHRFGLG
jgi:hypothetical protein